MTSKAWVLDCWDEPIGGYLAADVASGATVLPLQNAGRFAEDGGSLVINGTVVPFLSSDQVAETVTLVSPTTVALLTDDFVQTYDPVNARPLVDVRARVELCELGGITAGGEIGNAVDVSVAQPMQDRIARGARDGGRGEVVLLEDEGNGYRVVDLLATQLQVDASYLDLSTIPLSDGLPPSFSPTPTCTAAPTSLFGRWADVPNVDPVTYDVYVSATTPVAVDSAHLVASVTGTFVALQAAAGLWYMRLVARDRDGAAAPGLEGSVTVPGAVAPVDLTNLQTTLQAADTAMQANITTLQGKFPIQSADLGAAQVIASKMATNSIGPTSIQTDAVTSPKILAGAVIAGKIAADAVTANEIAANAVTASELAANSVIAAKIGAAEVIAGKLAADSVATANLQALSITAAKIATNAIEAGKIAANAVIAGNIDADVITSREIAVGQITADHLAAGTLEAGFVLAGKVQVGIDTWTPTEGLIFPGRMTVPAPYAQRVTINGAPTGGSFTLTADGVTTAAIAFNASAATVQTQVQTLGSLWTNAQVVGSAGGPWDIGIPAVTPERSLSATSSLTGGTSPSVSILNLTLPPSFTGGITATSLTVQKDFNLLGNTNNVKGVLALANGIVAPTVAPDMYQSWQSVGSHSMGFGAIESGLTEHLTDGTVLLSAVAFFGGGIVGQYRSNGQYVPFGYAQGDPANPGPFRGWCTGFNAYGITTLGGFYWVIGTDSNRSGNYYLYQLDASFNKTGEKLMYTPGGAKRPAIGNDGVGKLIMGTTVTTAGSTGTVFVRELDISAGGTAWQTAPFTFVNLTNFPGAGSYDMSYIGKGNFDFGATRYVISLAGNSTFVTDTAGTRLNNNNFSPASGGVTRGLWWDGTRFWAYNADGSLWKHGTNIVAELDTASYTFYDGAGTTHETSASPPSSFTRGPRTFLNVQTQLAPDSGVTDPLQVDKANRVGVYVATGTNTRRLQSYLGVNADGSTVRLLTIDTVTTGGQTETTPTGFGGATNSPGVFQTAGATTNVGVKVSGDGSWQMGQWSGAADGSLTTPKGGITFGAQTISAAGFVQQTTTPADDTGFPMRGGMSRSGSTLVVPVAGVYLVTVFTIFGNGTGTTNRVGTGIGTSFPQYAQDNRGNTGSSTMEWSGLVTCTAGQALSTYAYTDATTAAGTSQSSIRAVLVG